MSIGKIHHRESNKATLFCHLQTELSQRVVGLFPCSLYPWFLSQDSTLAKGKNRLLAAKSLLHYSPSSFWFSSWSLHSFVCLIYFCVRSGGEQEGRKEGYLRAVSFLLLLGKTRNQIQAIYRAQQQAPSLSRPSCPPCCFFLHGHPQGFQNPKFLLVCPCLRTSLGQAIIPDLLSSILLSLLVLFMSWL